MVNEISAAVEVASDAIDRLAITPVETMHHAISDRVFRSTWPLSVPVRVVHDRILGLMYPAVRSLNAATGAVLASGIRAGMGADVRPITASRRGRLAVGALNALLGDRLEEEGNDLVISMSIRHGGRDLTPERASIVAAYPDATQNLAVFVHGLGESEESWLRGAARHDGESALDFGTRLRADLGFSPLGVRYNTGLHVSENGRRLSVLLEAMVENWPVRVERLVLIGHSMGGLVARAACIAADGAGARWVGALDHVVTLGTPHSGAPLEKAVNLAARVLNSLPESRAIAGVLEMRSSGIRDLRFGYVQDSDWQDDNPGRLLQRRDRPPPPGLPCEHTFISASLARDPRHPLGWIAGDLLVRRDSAWGRHRRRPVAAPSTRLHHLHGLSHLDLLDHPQVYNLVRQALEHQNPTQPNPER